MSVCTIDVGLELKKANEKGFYEGYQLGTVHGMNACTDEEFKAEAKRRGYNLIKIPEKVKLLPCVCSTGRRKVEQWAVPGGWFYKCDHCALTSFVGRSHRKAKLNWNAMIEEKMKDEQ